MNKIIIRILSLTLCAVLFLTTIQVFAESKEQNISTEENNKLIKSKLLDEKGNEGVYNVY